MIQNGKIGQLLKKFHLSFIDLLVLVGIAIFSYWLMFSTFGYADGQFIMGSKLWSDFAAHIPLVRSFSMGDNFPPEYPTFPGEPIRYHYLFYFVVGMLEKMGLNLAFGMNILSVLGFGLLLWMIYQFGKLFFKSSMAGVLAVFLFLLNGSLTFIQYFEENGWNLLSIQNIPSLEHFVSFGPWDGGKIAAFWNLNIYTNQRHLGLSFGVALLLLWWLVQPFVARPTRYSFWKKSSVLCIFALLPLLNQAAFVMVAMFVGMWLGTLWVDEYLFKSKLFPMKQTYLKRTRIFGLGILISVASYLWFYPATQAVIEKQIGFLSNATSIRDFTSYWFQNLGLYLAAIPLSIWWVWKRFSGRKRGVLLLWMMFFTSYFVVANIFRLSTDMINNHKLVNFFMIGMDIVVAGFMVSKWQEKFFLRPIIVIFILGLTASGIIDFFPIKNDRRAWLNDFTTSDMPMWIAKNTEPSSVFVTTTYLYNPASMVGRKTYEDYGYFNWSMGYNDWERRQNLEWIFGIGVEFSDWCSRIQQEGIQYILISPGKGNLGDRIHIDESFLVRQNQTTFVSQEGYKLYSISQVCQNENHSK